MKRLGVVCIYDSEGIVHKYLQFYIESLKSVVDDIYFISNGDLQQQSVEILKTYSSKIYIRPNIGYDAGAYKFFLNNCITEEKLFLYDELVLANDTCFGPFKAFEDIFTEMNKKQADFWGLTFVDMNLYQFIQSDFLVFKKRTFSSLIYYFNNKIVGNAITKHMVCLQFERGLFKYLVEHDFNYSYYADVNKTEPYVGAYSLIANYNYPCMKKAGFRLHYNEYKDNLLFAIKKISEISNYDISLIDDYLWNKYNINIKEEMIDFSRVKEIPLECFDFGIKELRCFNSNMDEIYIYGTGKIAQDIYSYYQNEWRAFSGFIVSDSHYSLRELFGYSVYRISEIADKSAGIIVGLNKRNTQEVRKYLMAYQNVLYLWKLDK